MSCKFFGKGFDTICWGANEDEKTITSCYVKLWVTGNIQDTFETVEKVPLPEDFPSLQSPPMIY